MDPRKQKRLGPAPIASFEKSFDDNTATHYPNSNSIGGGLSAISRLPSNGFDEEIMDSSDVCADDGKDSSFHIHKGGNVGDDESMTNLNKDTQKQRQQQQQQQQQQQPIISVSQTGTKKLYEIGGKRLPPLKTANASLNSTTGSGDPMTPIKNATTLQTPSTPRIELSRASSSSYHEEDSRESSPENVFEQVGTGTLQETIGLGFREEGALELRSSTEELFFMDPEQKKEEQEKLQQQQTRRSSPLIFRFDDPQNYLQQHQRKDSASSEVAALLCISGRTSRVSSVGSQGSAVSRLSAISGVSRSPSPHRMLLETSFCGPKPLENVVDGRVVSTVEPPTAEALEQVLLARKQDPTQAVLAEGIKIESSPKRKSKTERFLPNGESSKEIEKRNESKSRQSRSIAAEISSISSGSSPSAKATMGNTRTSTKSPGQMVIGKTASGTEYIRINLKPDHMYNDKGIAANERVVEAPNSLAPVTSKASHRKPISLSLGRTMSPIEDGNRLTPSSSPKPSRHVALTKETIAGSRSPSPANAIASRKSSFSSLFKVKDSPDSPRERSRSRSKSKDHITVTPQSQSATPSKQKSVLAIFRPKRGSGAGVEAKSKSSSPIDGTDQQMMRSKSNTPQESSRPNSRLRYYEAPQDDKGIHIPLHTPPDEKEARKCIPGIEKLAAEPSIRPHSAPITASQLMAAAAALKPVSASTRTANAHVPVRPLLLNRATQRIENLDAIHTLSSDNSDEKELNWSLEVNRHSSQDSQGTIGSEASFPNNVKATSVRTNLTNVKESPVRENGIAAAAEIHRWPPTSQASLERKADESAAQVKNHPPQTGDAIAKEKRRLLFATRIGSGSQEQIFSTQFSLSKTESLTSQLSEQTSIPESPSAGQEQLQRQDTVLRRPDDLMAAAGVAAAAAARARGSEDRSCLSGSSSASYQVRKTDANLQRTKSSSTSDEDKAQQHHPVLLRKKDPNEESRRKSRSTSEDDDGIATAHHRHSRYLENFDVRKKFHENISRKGLRQNSDFAGAKDRERINEVDPQPLAINHEENAITSAPAFSTKKPTLPQTPPPSSSTTSPPPPPPPMKPPPSKQSSDERALQESPSIQSPLNRPVKPPRTSIPVSASPTPPPPQPPSASSLASPRHHHHSLSKHPDRQSNLSTDEPIESSESERDSDLASVASGDPSRRHLPRHVGVIEDHESTGLVSQDSFDDELPYIPTTLPEERAHGVSLIPVKERVHMELKTCPLDRPRSTTPMNPSHLEEYCTDQQQQHLQQSDHRPDHPIGVGSGLVRGEKLRISLPRKDSIKEKAQKTKSPRRVSNASGKSWFEFAEEGLRGSPLAATTTIDRKETTNETESLPSSTMLRKTSDQWIDFDSIPEKRKAPKRITALPKDATTRLHQQKQPDVTIPVAGTMKHQPQYNYVKPEDCQCECHEVERESSANAAARKPIANVDLLQQGEDLEPLLDPETNDGIDPSDSSREYSYYTDDEADMPRRQRKYSRTKSGGQYKNDEFPLRDGIQSPRNKKFPDNRC